MTFVFGAVKAVKNGKISSDEKMSTGPTAWLLTLCGSNKSTDREKYFPFERTQREREREPVCCLFLGRFSSHMDALLGAARQLRQRTAPGSSPVAQSSTPADSDAVDLAAEAAEDWDVIESSDGIPHDPAFTIATVRHPLLPWQSLFVEDQYCVLAAE